MTVKLRAGAPAKINLDLRVLAREIGGYHQIETVFLLVDLCDVVTVSTMRSGISLQVSGADLGATEDNLVYRAAEAFFNRSRIDSGADVQLEKRIPAGAGLGGGSSDAATTLRLLNALFGDPLARTELLEIAAVLGADVPFFLTESGFAFGWGRGGRLLEVPAPTPRHVVIALPEIPVSSQEAYGALVESAFALGKPRIVVQNVVSDWDRLASEASNDFEVTAFARQPVLSRIREALVEQGASLARMSGSGSALFGVFQTAEQAHGAAEKVGVAFECRCVTVLSRSRWTDIEVPEG